MVAHRSPRVGGRQIGIRRGSSASADAGSQQALRGAASAAPAAQPPPRDPEEHFVPPEPPPLPSGDPVTRWAWAGLVGAPLFFVLAALLGWRVEGWTALLAVSAFVAGFVTLVARMSDRHADDDPDDGAVV